MNAYMAPIRYLDQGDSPYQTLTSLMCEGRG
jgi:hypothetical protein